MASARPTLPKLVRVLLGTTLFGIGIAMMARSDLGLEPWSVLHQGLAERTGLAMGTIDILTGIAVLALWVPLRQTPGWGTISAVLMIGLFTNIGLDMVSPASGMGEAAVLLAVGIVLIATGSGMYLSVDLGAGPRDGIMTGLHRTVGYSVRTVRTAIEISVLCAGWLLGGTVGIGTVVFSATIGPLVHTSIVLFTRHPPRQSGSSLALH